MGLGDIFLKLFGTPLYTLANSFFRWSKVGPIKEKVRVHLKNRYGPDFVQEDMFHFRISSEPFHIDEITRCVYIPIMELVGMEPNTEAILIQELVRRNSFSLIEVACPEFYQAFVAFETSNLLISEPNGAIKAEKHFLNVYKRNPTNKSLETIRLMHEKGILKRSVDNMLKEWNSVPITERVYNPQLIRKCAKIISDGELEAQKASAEEIEHDSLTDEQLVKKYPDADKSTHRFSSQQVVTAIVTNKPLMQGKGLISYYSVAKIVLNKPGRTPLELASLLNRQYVVIQWAIIALLPKKSSKNGLELVERKKENSRTRIYPSQNFLRLLREYKNKKK